MKSLSRIAITVLLLAAAVLPSEPAGRALDWLNRFRAQAGLSGLAPEPALGRAAMEYARILASAGRLAHRDPQGRSALQRYRAAGGGAVRVGEILGAGASLAAVASAWEASPSHAGIVLRPQWTHAAAGFAAFSGGEVWVVLFTEHQVEDFAVLPEAGGFAVSGRFLSPQAFQPLLLTGIELVQALEWDPQRRSFRFWVPVQAGGLYHRLGYLSVSGELAITDAFFPALAATSSPDREPR